MADTSGVMPPPSARPVAPSMATTATSGTTSAAAPPRREIRFGDWVLGRTLGEGEFGKVKLGWPRRRDSSNFDTQVAIKLIRKQHVSAEHARIAKVQREINILRRVKHPNIVRLLDVLESDKHIGIVLEFASGGELFDYILKHRYLKDATAGRLFAQLISGVSYLHAQGIVHRDLKLENLLLDRNMNMIITDFGFATLFNPREAPGGPESRIRNSGPRRADLMETSCGSPCYAAPELVVSDARYHGRKVDVWSCGVILYSMLAGYLPFDDDPNNPDGDNIGLLYKYITTVPLTFPEYVTPVARDLLRTMIVPDPERRTDLDRVKGHTFLAPYQEILRQSPTPHDLVAGFRALGMERSMSERGTTPIIPPQAESMAPPMAPPPPHPTIRSRQQPVTTTNKRLSLQTDLAATERPTIRVVNPPASVEVSSKMHRSATLTPTSRNENTYDTLRASDSTAAPLQPNTQQLNRLPPPSSKPRPTSYHPSFAAPTFASTARQSNDTSAALATLTANSSANSSTLPRSNTTILSSAGAGDTGTPGWHARRHSLLQRTGSTARSTNMNAPGEISRRGHVTNTGQEDMPSGHHRKAAASVGGDLTFDTNIANKRRSGIDPLAASRARITSEQVSLPPQPPAQAAAVPVAVPGPPPARSASQKRPRTERFSFSRSNTMSGISSLLFSRQPAERPAERPTERSVQGPAERPAERPPAYPPPPGASGIPRSTSTTTRRMFSFFSRSRGNGAGGASAQASLVSGSR